MQGINEIRKQNAAILGDAEHEREANFVVKPNGSVWLRSGVKTKIFEKGRDDNDIADFFDSIRDKSAGQQKVIIKSHFN